MKRRYFTKSRFKLALQCPTKLYYCDKPQYANNKTDDAFLEALAEGGFQVGALARCYFPGGITIDTYDYIKAANMTPRLLQNENIIIYEAAVLYENLFIRIDILKKTGNKIELIEVKSKSFDGINEFDLLEIDGSIANDWVEYIQDIAYQKYVFECAYSTYEVSSNLMFADKNSKCPTDGLNQKFKIINNGNKKIRIKTSDTLSEDDLKNKILIKINVDICCKTIFNNIYEVNGKTLSYKQYIRFLSEKYISDEKIPPIPSIICGKCEFNTKNNNKELKSGFKECWSEALGWTEEDFKEPLIFEIWNFSKKKALMQNGIYKISQIDQEHIKPGPDKKSGISVKQRQWLQIEKTRNKDASHWIDKDNLANEIMSWTYPLHFIDFETTAAAIPFNKKRRPYEGIAFQFSHHVVYEDGRIEHAGQYLNTEAGMFPNYDFIRNLKNQLDKDNGSIFRYAAHENTYLNLIYRQLIEEGEYIADRNELLGFIRTVTYHTDKSGELWVGKRNMIDMLEIVKRYYYDPYMKGSNSIKKVLPAILNSSDYLKYKYSKPIYGSDVIKSHNYKNWSWVDIENGEVKDPYMLLPELKVQDFEDYDTYYESRSIREGGAAMMAYARMQFEEISDIERQEINKALLRYCELDTMAMVMIYEGWRDLIGYK